MGVMDHDHWRILEPLLDEALELPVEERESWLNELREQSPTLAAELTTLLSEERSAEEHGFLAVPPSPLGGTLQGLRLGAYTLERPLGQGGMGSVWLARRSDGRFEGQAAVKLLNLALLSAAGEARFRREGSLLARLAHPGIARLLDAGVSPSGQPYLVLEYVDGQRIDRYAEEHGASLEARIRLVLQVLSAVGHAHAHLIVHRDLKPSNILVTPDGAVKLLDFGIAKLLNDHAVSPEGAFGRTLTTEGAYILTPEFAAPEQALSGPITTATDVYAAGVLLYLLASGRHPTAEGCQTPAEAMRALAEVTPARLGLGDLDTILGKALRKEPQERYQTVEALAGDLERYLRHEPISARRDSLAYRARTFVRRHRAGVGTAAVTAAALIAATVFSIAQMRAAQRQRDAAVFEQKRSDAVVEFQNLLLGDIGGATVTMRDILDRGTILLDRSYLKEPRVAANIAMTLGVQYGALGAYDRELTMLNRAESLAVAVGAADVLLTSRCRRAETLGELGMGRRALAVLDSIRPRLASAEPADAEACLVSMAEVDLRMQRYDSAAVAGERAADIMERLGQSSNTDYIGVLNILANAYENLNRGRKALTIYRRLAALMDSTGRGESIDRNVIRNNIGIALTDLGEMTAAMPILQKTVQEFLRTDSSGYYVHPAILSNYCRTALFLGQLDSAGTWYERLYRESVPQKDPAMEEGAYGMAEVELARGRLADAERWIAEEKRVNALLPHPRPANGLVLEAALTHARGNPTAALAMYRRALGIMGYDAGKRTFQMQPVLMRAAEAALDAHAPGEALQYARAAHHIAAADSLTETRSGYVGATRLLEGRALLASGDSSGARAALTVAAMGLSNGVGAEHPRTRQALALLAALRR
ncbi:MAG TPA: protein kinase [Gemmatimonadaceae bacterium]|nr:protein kinase [Gemmatimonadaceae bacterium]